MALEHLRLEDYSDRELLLVIDDLAEDGWVDSLDLAQRLGIVGDYPRRTVASRLIWLVRYGVVQREHERDPDTGQLRYTRDGRVRYTQRWGLTGVGHDLAHGTLRKGDESALGRLRDDQMILVARWVQQRAHGNGTAPMAKLVDREWRRAELMRKT